MFFALGVLARLAKSDLRLPEALYEALSIYLLLAIGLKGGVELAQQPVAAVLPQALAAIALGAAIPFLLFPVLLKIGRLPRADSASIAAHYGSVSVVTFAVASSFLLQQKVPAETYLPLLVALMEAPGIVSGIVLARTGRTQRIAWRALAHEIAFGKSVVLLCSAGSPSAPSRGRPARSQLSRCSWACSRECWRCSCSKWGWSPARGWQS